jgi:hypothetical protein
MAGIPGEKLSVDLWQWLRRFARQGLTEVDDFRLNVRGKITATTGICTLW